MNKVEAEMLLCVFQQFMRKLPELMQRPATAVITPYKAQVGFPALRMLVVLHWITSVHRRRPAVDGSAVPVVSRPMDFCDLPVCR